MDKKKPIFRELNADDPEPEASEMESLCMNCHSTGITRLLLTKIPFYKEVIIMSFSCEACGYENNEIQSGASVSPEGVRYTLHIQTEADLNRQVVKSDYSSIKIPEIDFEIPAKSQKGEVTTVEGIIERTITGLEQDQTLRRIQDPNSALKIDEFIAKLKGLKELKQTFTIVLEDISGNSFIENLKAPQSDPSCTTHYFKRTKKQDEELGFYSQDESNILQPIQEGEFNLGDLEGEVLQFSTNCPNCSTPCQTNMKMTNIPHFKEVVIMATNCDACGHKTNEVKSGGGIEPKGVHIEVFVSGREDFSRDVLKSETCDLKIPELDLEVGPHALGGRFTTVEGLLVAIRDQLSGSNHTQMFGDSVGEKPKTRMVNFLKKIDDILAGNKKVTIVLDDPAGNSYIQDLSENGSDKGLKIEHYERSFEQNENLGLNDIKTDNY